MHVRGSEGDHRVTENHEVRTRTDAIDRVGRTGVAGIEMSACSRRQMSTRGKSPDPDFLRSDPILRGMIARITNRTLRVAQFDGMVIPRTQAILEDERNHATSGEPLSHLFAFMVHGQHPVTAPRANHHTAARGLA